MSTDPYITLHPPYSTIVVDPPWDYSEGFVTRSRTPGKWQGPHRTYALPYSSLTVEAIAALPVADLADADCRLFLWTTNRYLPSAFGVMEAWGFRYRQVLVWHKLDGNLGGSIAPNSAEFLLVGVRGCPKTLDRLKASVVSHSQTKTHSAKPALFLDLVERVSPGHYVELFARQPRLGWDSWGWGYEKSA